MAKNPTPQTVKLMYDSSEFDAAVASFLALIEIADSPLEIRRAFAQSILDLLNEGGAINFDRPFTEFTGKVVICLKPSQRFLDLVAAFRAGD